MYSDLLIIYPFTNKKAKVLKLYLEEEKKFLDFVTSVYYLNKGFVKVYSPETNILNNRFYKRLFKSLEKKEKKIINILLNNLHDKKFFNIDDLEVLHLLTKLSLREICFSNFFFVNTESIIIGNFELSFPIYCIDRKELETYKKFTCETGLFIRT